MPAHPDYPFAFPWNDRHGKPRWRFRRGEKTVYLRGLPHEDAFDDSYYRALNGLETTAAAEVIKHPGATVPKSLRAAWRVYTTNFPEWQANGAGTKAQQTAYAESFLLEKIASEADDIWADVPVADLKRRHVRKILADMSDRPHAGRHRLTVMRKMIMAAIEEEWIEADPTYKLKYRPATIKGFRPWTEDEMLAYEERWPIGTTPRLVYEMALWLGARRCDIARMRPQDIVDDLAVWTQQKTDNPVGVPITKWVAAAFAQNDMSNETIVTTEYGKPFSTKSLTGRMRDWSGAARLKGCTLHGLRKTLGKRVTDAKGTTRQAMAVLGHETMEQAELYSRQADREDLARDALAKVVSMVEKRRAKGG